MKKYKLCPICGEFNFIVENNDAIDPLTEFSDTIMYQHCFTCAWTYDPLQLKDHNVVTDRNPISYNERKQIMKDGLKNDKKFNYYFQLHPLVPHLCPVCKEFMFPSEESYEICKICGWQDDTNDPINNESLVNEMSYEDFLAEYESKKGKKK